MDGAVSANLGPKHVKWCALLACIATILGLSIPMWDMAHRMLALRSNIGALGAFAVIVVISGFAAIVPSFYFALYRNQGELPLSRNTRWVALTAAAVIAVLSVAVLPGWIASFQTASVLHHAGRPWTISDTSSVFGQISNPAGVLLLASFFRLASDGHSQSAGGTSNLLRLLTMIAVIAGGIVVLGAVVGLAATPWVYFEIRDRLLEVGSSASGVTFWRFALDRFRAALGAVSVYIVPFMVWHGTRTQTPQQGN